VFILKIMDNLMKKVMFCGDVGSLKWPAKCPGCAADVTADKTNATDVIVGRDLSVTFAPPFTLPVNLCATCLQRISKYAVRDKFTNFFWWLFFALFCIPSMLIGIGFITKSNALLEIATIFSAGLCVCAIVLAEALRGTIKQRIVGVKCLRMSKKQMDV